MNDPLLVGVREAARRLGYPRDRVYQAIAEGRLPALHVGRSLKVPRDRLAEFIDRELARQAEAGGRLRPVARGGP